MLFVVNSFKVQPGEGNKAAFNDMRALSGGERSFSTVCFILSLWSIAESPFRCLDEFDVYMVVLNFKISNVFGRGEGGCVLWKEAVLSLVLAIMKDPAQALQCVVSAEETPENSRRGSRSRADPSWRRPPPSPRGCPCPPPGGLQPASIFCVNKNWKPVPRPRSLGSRCCWFSLSLHSHSSKSSVYNARE